MAAINRAVATLRVMGENLQPEEITQLLGSNPSYAQRKGQVLARPPGRVAKFGMWRVDAPQMEPSEFNDQIAALISGLTQDLSIWEQLSSKYKIDLFCGWFMGESNEGEEISPSTLLALASRKIALSLDIYAPDEGEQAPSPESANESSL